MIIRTESHRCDRCLQEIADNPEALYEKMKECAAGLRSRRYQSGVWDESAAEFVAAWIGNSTKWSPLLCEPCAEGLVQYLSEGREGSVSTAEAKAPTSQRQLDRVAKMQAWIDEGERKAFTANEAMDALKCSRQTALRTVAAMDNIRKEGNASTARYVVS